MNVFYYDRVADEIKTLVPQVGFSESFVYDKTTDKADVSFVLSAKPSIDIGSWAFMCEDATLTFTAEGLPLNHRQYIVSNYEAVESKDQARWHINFKMVEPIEWLKGVQTETLSFTNQTEKVVTVGGVPTTCEKERYTFASALERLLKVTPTNNDTLLEAFRGGEYSWLQRIRILDADFLESLNFDDDSWSAADLYTALFKLDDSIDRTPVIYFDMRTAGQKREPILKNASETEIDFSMLDSGFVNNSAFYKYYSFNKTSTSNSYTLFENLNICAFESGNINTASGENVISNTRLRFQEYAPIIPSTQFSLNYKGADKCLVLYYSSTKTLLGNSGWQTGDFSFTTASNVYYIRALFANADDGAISTSDLDDLWIEELPSGAIYSNLRYNELIVGDKIYATINGFDLTVYEVVSKIGTETLTVYVKLKTFETEITAAVLPNNKNRASYLLKFERKDGFDKTILDYNTVISGCTMFSESKSRENYATGVTSETTNLSSGVVVKFPADGLFAVPEVDTDDRDTTDYITDNRKWILQLPFPIKKINSIKVADIKVIAKQGVYAEYLVENSIRTVASEDILEEKQYLASDYIETLANYGKAFWYKEGETKLHLDEYFYFYLPFSKGTKVYYVEYEPLIENKMQIGGGDYIVSVNQNDSQIESGKFSNFLTNYLTAMNKADVLFIKRHTSVADIYDVGSLVESSTDNYIISAVAYKNVGNSYYATYQLNKDNLRRNMSVRASEQIRENRVIEYNNLKDRRSLVVEDILIDTVAVPYGSSKYLLKEQKKLFLSALMPMVVTEKTPSLCAFKYSSEFIGVAVTAKYLATISKHINAGQVQFNINIKNNAEIGKTKTTVNENFIVEQNVYTAPTVNPNAQLPVIYTDPFGEMQKLTLSFSNINFTPTLFDTDGFIGSSDPDYEEAQAVYENTRNLYITMTKLPVLTGEIETILNTNSNFKIGNINYYKDMLERFNFSVVFNVKSNNKNLVVCKKMLELSRAMQNKDTHTLRIYGFSSYKAENDLMTENALWDAVATSSTTSGVISFVFTGQSTTGLKSIIIATDDGEKLLIINKPNLTQVTAGSVTIRY